MNPLSTLTKYWKHVGIVTPFLCYWPELMELVLTIMVLWDRTMDQITLPFQNNQSTFDFVIVGGGTAGSILATRLAQNHSVLLLEAGGTPSYFQSIPFHLYFLFHMKPIDWSHETTPQKFSAFGLKNNVVFLPGGKSLGGSSAINGMVYVRGNVQGFDEIAEKTEDPIWKMENMLKYFKKIENYDGAFKDGPAGVHGKGGYTNVETPTVTLPVIKQLIKAGSELGYPDRDSNIMGPYTEGFSVIELMEKSGARYGVYDSLLLPQRNNPNLTVRKFSHVTRVLFEGTEAFGVEYERHGKLCVANASKEVILSAGTLMSPKILMLSGIGPKTHLEEVGINTVLDLPVGQRFQDKYGATVGPFIVDEGTSFLKTRDIGLMSILEYLFYGTGYITTTRSDATLAILTNASRNLGMTSAPDIHGYVIPYSPDDMTKQDMKSIYNADKELAGYLEKIFYKDTFSVLLTIAKPYGSGTIKLRNKNPHSPAIIDPEYLKDERDVAALVEGVRFLVKLTETEAMKKINAHLSPEKHPACHIHEFKSDKYYECLLRYATQTAYKFCGTAPLGKDTTDPHAVVDSHLRVLGAQRLRVVDASVLNTKHVSVNDVVVRAMTEMISEIILNEWKDGGNPWTSNDRNNPPGVPESKFTQPKIVDEQNSCNNETNGDSPKEMAIMETSNACQWKDHLLYHLDTVERKPSKDEF